MPFYKLKTGPSCFWFFLFTHLILPAERRGFLKIKQTKTTKKTHFYELKTGPIRVSISKSRSSACQRGQQHGWISHSQKQLHSTKTTHCSAPRLPIGSEGGPQFVWSLVTSRFVSCDVNPWLYMLQPQPHLRAKPTSDQHLVSMFHSEYVCPRVQPRCGIQWSDAIKAFAVFPNTSTRQIEMPREVQGLCCNQILVRVFSSCSSSNESSFLWLLMCLLQVISCSRSASAVSSLGSYRLQICLPLFGLHSEWFEPSALPISPNRSNGLHA